MKTIQSQWNFAAIKWIYRGVETILLKSNLAGLPSTVCLKSIVTGLDDHNYASLTFASRRKNRPDHGSCLRNTRARLVFPLTTCVRPAEDKDKKYLTWSGSTGGRRSYDGIERLKKLRQFRTMKTIQAQWNFAAIKWIYRGNDTIKKLPGRGAFDNVPEIDCHSPWRSHNQRQVQCQPLSGVAGRSWTG